MTAPMFYISAEQMQALAAGSVFELRGAEGKHALVKRMELGEEISLGDGSGAYAHGTVDAILPDGVAVRVETLGIEVPAPATYLVQALAKDGRDLLGIETATELGVAGVVPWSADRSIVRWKGDRAAKAHAKWENTVYAAAKQSRRALIPTVYDLHSSVELAEFIAQVTAPAEGSEQSDSAIPEAAVFILHENATERLSTQLSALVSSENLPAEIYVIVGPEGGIAPREVELFTQAGARLALLGTEVLRASTAGSAALCVLNTVTGRF
ncbi:MAG: 16S rRNA (uracil(1498)-N(3))-methyltransferase [Rothia sp. (in: high G+C Gram-positive bacteria)]|uniref:16S rRNA (uracil(1498)-N(3))-methyltransferase n=1 Tax=Rothia sp. (in: high G+C Gram-positive bacteria) TaxID=1885016 RepID=UPI0026DF45BA|nr:16S rRNA (uracil(1498)-N(3))-methyltransferase [Rothia sp. (in: high G+C Gram-positive bacteria)]MDO5750624.1 16S rRNA (uracil(1498)-N(3))-methyltransferase [Rothia sp. (in: high G+C Gram-positive bacteria)]